MHPEFRWCMHTSPKYQCRQFKPERNKANTFRFTVNSAFSSRALIFGLFSFDTFTDLTSQHEYILCSDADFTAFLQSKSRNAALGILCHSRYFLHPSIHPSILCILVFPFLGGNCLCREAWTTSTMLFSMKKRWAFFSTRWHYLKWLIHSTNKMFKNRLSRHQWKKTTLHDYFFYQCKGQRNQSLHLGTWPKSSMNIMNCLNVPSENCIQCLSQHNSCSG